MNVLKEGVGEDGESVKLERVHNACFLVHAEGNSESPFEFSDLSSAEQFMNLIAKFRMEDRIAQFFEE